MKTMVFTLGLDGTNGFIPHNTCFDTCFCTSWQLMYSHLLCFVLAVCHFIMYLIELVIVREAKYVYSIHKTMFHFTLGYVASVHLKYFSRYLILLHVGFELTGKIIITLQECISETKEPVSKDNV